jgi:hypothetical protein
MSLSLYHHSTFPYLYKNLLWMKDGGLNNCNQFMEKQKNYILYSVKKYVKRHPEHSSLLNFQLPVLSGGSVSEKLQNIYEAIKSINPQNINNVQINLKDLDDAIEKLNQKLNDTSNGKIMIENSLQESILSSVDIIRSGIKNLNEIDVSKSTGKIPTFVKSNENFKELKISEQIKNLSDQLNQIIKYHETNQLSLRDETLKSLRIDIMKSNDDYKNKSDEIKLININLEKVIQQLQDSINYYDIKTEQNQITKEVRFVPTFKKFLENLLEKLESSSILHDKKEKIKEIIKSVIQENNEYFCIITDNKEKQECKRSIGSRIDEFNLRIIPHINDIRQLPEFEEFTKYYDGINNIRINNMFFMRDGIINLKVVNDIITDEKQTNYFLNELKNDKSFNNAFIEFPVDEIKRAEQVVQSMQGGVNNFETQLDEMKTILQQNSNLIITYQTYNELLQKYNRNITTLNSLLLNQLMHNLFLVMIAFNQLLTSNYIIHEYLQRGTLSLYKRILENMQKEILKYEANPSLTKPPHIIYLIKYHKFTITKLFNFIVNLVDYLNTEKAERAKKCTELECASHPQKIMCNRACAKDKNIDINSCTGKTADCFLLLNHFKDILMQYNSMYASKVTIYARVNDLGDTMEPNNVESCGQMTYLSMFDTAIRPDTESCALKVDNQDILKQQPDAKQLIVSLDTCPEAKKEFQGKVNDIEKIQFTEVFDPTLYPENGDISKYMTVETLLAQKRGIAMMTYGYSGTGKTFTLFGNNEQKLQGILQSTLNGINGLKKVQFRLIELYGYGVPYPHYWQLNLDGIYHRIYHYVIVNKPDEKLTTEETYEIMPTNFSDYINDNVSKISAKDKYGKTISSLGESSYITVPENQIDEVFQKFENFVNNVDRERINTQRIRDTPNNPVSSRSVVIYDFKLTVSGDNEQDNTVPFLIVDLPGREEIVQTYVEPYLKNPVIREILDKKTSAESKYNLVTSEFEKSDDFKRLKLMLGFAALNPLGMVLFDPELVIDTILFSDGSTKKKPRNTVDLIGKMPMKFSVNKDVAGSVPDPNNSKMNILTGEFDLMEEKINPNGKNLGLFITVQKEKNYIKSYDVKLKTEGGNNIFGMGYSSKKQNFMVFGIHLLNRVIMKNKFDLLKQIIEKFCEKYINRYIVDWLDKFTSLDANLKNKLEKLAETNFKSYFWKSQYESLIKKEGELLVKDGKKTKLYDLILNVFTYNYYLTPYEGIYINENIIGLIKYLAYTSKLPGTGSISKDDEENATKFVRQIVCEQDTSLNFSNQQKIVRVWASNQETGEEKMQELYHFPDKAKPKNPNIPEKCHHEEKLGLPIRFIKKVENEVITYDYSLFDTIYQTLIESYKSDQIFNFEKPMIKTLLEPYMVKIFDYKVLYLLANYKKEEVRNRKCKHQYKLFYNTKDFIQSIAGNN